MTELSRHMPTTEASTIQAALGGLLSLIAQAAEKASRAEAEGSATCVWDCDDGDLDCDTPDDVLLDTLERGSEGDAQEMLRTVRRRIRAPWLRRKAQQDDADDCRVGKHGQLHVTPRLSVPLLEQGYAKDNEAKSSNACLMTWVQTSSPYRSTGSKRLDRDVVDSSSR